MAVAPAGMLQHSRAPIRCQILGCFQATYIRLRGKRASNALKDVFPCLKASALVCFCARVNEGEGKGERERGCEGSESRTNFKCLTAFDVLTCRNERRTAI